MYLMYYLNDEGERVYTLKVILLSSIYQIWTQFNKTKRFFWNQHVDPKGKPTFSAHPGIVFCCNFLLVLYFKNFWMFLARFSPEDKYSQHRLIIKKRFNLLPTQKASVVYWFSCLTAPPFLCKVILQSIQVMCL